MAQVLLRLAAASAIAAAARAACATDEDCSLSGSCTAGSCVCNAGWVGDTCALLDRRTPASRASAGIYGFSPNVTSWGGSILTDNATGLHHLYVSEIAGPCGLVSWGSHSTVIHAVSKTPEGPFVKKSVAVARARSIGNAVNDWPTNRGRTERDREFVNPISEDSRAICRAVSGLWLALMLRNKA